jgi:uncharacterized protein (DUF4415 family)
MSGKPVIVSHTPRPLTAEERSELEALAQRPDDEIDYSDIPATGAADWKDALMNPFLYPPVRLDRRVVEWFRDKYGDGGALMTEVNKVLLEHIAAESKKAGRKAG